MCFWSYSARKSKRHASAYFVWSWKRSRKDTEDCYILVSDRLCRTVHALMGVKGMSERNQVVFRAVKLGEIKVFGY